MSMSISSISPGVTLTIGFPVDAFDAELLTSIGLPSLTPSRNTE